MDFELPITPVEPIARAPREPAWTGLQLLLFILVTLFAMAAASLATFLVWALVAHAAGAAAQRPDMAQLVWISLIGQTIGFGFGVGFTWLYIQSGRTGSFWGAMHWRRLRGGQVLAIVGAGLATMIGSQALGHLLPMPNSVPMEQMFTPQTAWLLVVYGVGIAPFFEEFFFRGLLYPTFLATFTDGAGGLSGLRHWRPVVMAVGAVVAVGAMLWRVRDSIVTPGGMHVGLWVVAALGLAAIVVPDIPLRGMAWAIDRLAGERRPELFAILLTGFLFGLMHASQLGFAWAAVLILMLVGVMLTWVRAATGSLMASWIFHCAYNGSLFVAQYFATQGFHHFPTGMH